MWKRIIAAIWKNIAEGAETVGASQGAAEFGNWAYERNRK
jgi:hypothetical protein